MDIVSYAPAAGPARSATAAAEAPPGPSEAARLAWVDVAKGICIVLVVTMHATLGVEAAMGREGFMNAVVDFSKPFRMPDFFLVSGLFLSRVIGRDWRSYADKRVLHFAYFYVLWLLIQSLIKFGQVSDGSLRGFVEHLAVSLVEPYSTLWFIYILAVFSVATKLLRGLAPAHLFGLAAVLQVLPIETGSFLLTEFCERWVYFVAGYLFAGPIFRLAEGAAARPLLALAGLAAWALANGMLALTPVAVLDATTLAELPVVGLATGLAGAVAIVTAASLLAGWAVAEPLRYAGSRSIAIYLTFFLPMAATRTVLVGTLGLADPGIVAAAVIAVSCLVPLLIERMVRGTRLSFLYERPGWVRLPAPGREAPGRPALSGRPSDNPGTRLPPPRLSAPA